MTRATSTTIPAFVLALAATVGCATSRPRLQLPPYTLMSATTLDSAEVIRRTTALTRASNSRMSNGLVT